MFLSAFVQLLKTLCAAGIMSESNIFIVFSCIFWCVSLILSNFIAFLFLRYNASILRIHRNTVTQLNILLIFAMNMCSSTLAIFSDLCLPWESQLQCLSVLWHGLYGSMSIYAAIASRALFFSSFYLFHCTVFSVNIFRIIIVLEVKSKPLRLKWNVFFSQQHFVIFRMRLFLTI